MVLVGCLDFERRGWSRSRYQTHSCVLYTLAPSFQRKKNYYHNEPNVRDDVLFSFLFILFLFFLVVNTCMYVYMHKRLMLISDRFVSNIYAYNSRGKDLESFLESWDNYIFVKKLFSHSILFDCILFTVFSIMRETFFFST